MGIYNNLTIYFITYKLGLNWTYHDGNNYYLFCPWSGYMFVMFVTTTLFVGCQWVRKYRKCLLQIHIHILFNQSKPLILFFNWIFFMSFVSYIFNQQKCFYKRVKRLCEIIWNKHHLTKINAKYRRVYICIYINHLWISLKYIGLLKLK